MTRHKDFLFPTKILNNLFHRIKLNETELSSRVGTSRKMCARLDGWCYNKLALKSVGHYPMPQANYRKPTILTIQVQLSDNIKYIRT